MRLNDEVCPIELQGLGDNGKDKWRVYKEQRASGGYRGLLYVGRELFAIIQKTEKLKCALPYKISFQ